MPARDPLLTIDQAAELLATGPRFPRRLVAERRIRFVHVGRHVRIPESALIEYVLANTVEPVTVRRRRGEGCLMPGKRRFGRVRQLPSGRWQRATSARTGSTGRLIAPLSARRTLTGGWRRLRRTFSMPTGRTLTWAGSS